MRLIGKNIKKFIFKKNRPDDFINEIKHIEKDLLNNDNAYESPISFLEGFKTMKLINECFSRVYKKNII